MTGKPRGPHSLARFRVVSENIGKLQRASVAAIGQAESDNLGHDARSNAQTLARFAAAWEHHCRITGQDPLSYTNDDGTPDRLVR